MIDFGLDENGLPELLERMFDVNEVDPAQTHAFESAVMDAFYSMHGDFLDDETIANRFSIICECYRRRRAHNACGSVRKCVRVCVCV
jgi:hypothetical protein